MPTVGGYAKEIGKPTWKPQSSGQPTAHALHRVTVAIRKPGRLPVESFQRHVSGSISLLGPSFFIGG